MGYHAHSIAHVSERKYRCNNLFIKIDSGDDIEVNYTMFMIYMCNVIGDKAISS